MMEMTSKKLGWAIGLGGFLLIGVVIFFMSLSTVKQGHVGVVYSANGGVQGEVKTQGVHFVKPWEKVTEYPVALETVTFDNVPLATRDGKPLSMELNFNYSNDPQEVVNIFNKFKGATSTDIEQSFLLSRAKDSALEVTSKYTILEIFQNRGEIQTAIAQHFTDEVGKYGFVVSDFVIGTPTPDPQTQEAIQRVVDAQQKLEALRVETQQAEEEAKRKIVEAEGQAEAEIAEAKGTAEANKLIQESITPELLKKMEMEARIEHGWVEVNGANAVVVD